MINGYQTQDTHDSSLYPQIFVSTFEFFGENRTGNVA